MGQVQGKVALVTGGASGIGAACSATLAREGAKILQGPFAGMAYVEEATEGAFVARLLANPISAWLTGMAVVLQLLAVVCVRRLARPAVVA